MRACTPMWQTVGGLCERSFRSRLFCHVLLLTRRGLAGYASAWRSLLHSAHEHTVRVVFALRCVVQWTANESWPSWTQLTLCALVCRVPFRFRFRQQKRNHNRLAYFSLDSFRAAFLSRAPFSFTAFHTCTHGFLQLRELKPPAVLIGVLTLPPSAARRVGTFGHRKFSNALLPCVADALCTLYILLLHRLFSPSVSFSSFFSIRLFSFNSSLHLRCVRLRFAFL